MEREATLALFDEVAASVRDAVVVADRGESGERPGQYRLDVDADSVVVARLLAAGFGVVSEESGRHAPDRQMCVVVDPVDGSTNASRGLPCWATSLCAVDADGPWVAAVVDQSRGVTYRARRGAGATRQVGDAAEVAIGVAAEAELGDAIVAVNGWSADRPRWRQQRSLGSAAIEVCLVADGSFDAYANLDPDSHGPWDYLGALLVLDEAGGVAADASGRELVTVDPAERRTLFAASGRGLLVGVMAR